MRRVYITTILTAILVLAVFAGVQYKWDGASEPEVLKVGFIYENDESAPYTYNFALAQKALERELGDRVQTFAHSNVPDDETQGPVEELVRKGCGIIFTNNYSEQIVEDARLFPDIQFCQCSYNAGIHEDCPSNYHTFNGEIYQARYVSGIAAGLKLREMIDRGTLAPEEALVGYVGAFRSVEVVSGYTAFLLGVRSVAPETTMRVRYTGTWSSYNREKACAKALIDEGCVIIAQHTDTIGPAMACEEAGEEKRVFHVGYNKDMSDIAPGTSLVSARVNWTPYVMGAVTATLKGEPIEQRMGGSVHGNDVSAGFDRGWVQVLELNRKLTTSDTEDRLKEAIEALQKGSLEVFKGEYTGVNPDDPSDTVDLRQGYRENEKTSWPTFHYILKDVIVEEE